MKVTNAYLISYITILKKLSKSSWKHHSNNLRGVRINAEQIHLLIVCDMRIFVSYDKGNSWEIVVNSPVKWRLQLSKFINKAVLDVESIEPVIVKLLNLKVKDIQPIYR